MALSRAEHHYSSFNLTYIQPNAFASENDWRFGPSHRRSRVDGSGDYWLVKLSENLQKIDDIVAFAAIYNVTVSP